MSIYLRQKADANLLKLSQVGANVLKFENAKEVTRSALKRRRRINLNPLERSIKTETILRNTRGSERLSPR